MEDDNSVIQYKLKLDSHIDKRENKFGNFVDVVCKNKWYGSYNVPSAIGFATPIHLLEGGSLVCSDNISVTATENVFQCLDKFLSVYNTNSKIKSINPTVINDTHFTCCICTEEYKCHDKIIDLSCNHKFHYDCITKYVVSKCDVVNCTDFKSHMTHTAYGYISNENTKCPYCNNTIAF